jgi:DnaJ-like protein
MSGDHYKILCVRRDASAEDIQRSYRALALQYHPDRNASPDAAARMTAINEAWEVLGDLRRRRDYDVLLTQPSLHPEFAASILLAARDVLLRQGWRVLEDNVKTLVLENSRQRVRVVFLERVDNAALLGLARQFPEFCVVLSVRVEGPIGPSAVAIDLIHSERYGAALPDGPDGPDAHGGSCGSLFAAFL